MKELVCVQPFGTHVPGDVIEVEDDAEVSTLYFVPKDEAPSQDLATADAEGETQYEGDHDVPAHEAAQAENEEKEG
jgi:hypothetical protein